MVGGTEWVEVEERGRRNRYGTERYKGRDGDDGGKGNSKEERAVFGS